MLYKVPAIYAKICLAERALFVSMLEKSSEKSEKSVSYRYRKNRLVCEKNRYRKNRRIGQVNPLVERACL